MRRLIRTPFFLALLSLALFLFWMLPLGRALFAPIDTRVACFLHSFLQQGPFFWHFFAFLNSNLGDWLFDFVMGSFFFYYCLKAPKGERVERIFLSVSLLLFYFLVYECYSYLFNKAWKFSRFSPSLVLPDFLYLSDLVDWAKVKDHSSRCYPSGHGNTIFLFLISIFILMGSRMGLLSLLCILPFLLPRLVVGAHWLSDYLFGSLPLALLNLSLLFYSSPFYRILYEKKESRVLPETP